MAVTPADVEAKDPNGDGVITMADVAFMYQILGGKYNPSDLTRFDIDDNDVVSDVDAIYTQMYTAGMLSNSLQYVSSIQSIQPTDEINATNSTYSEKTYNVYTAGSGVFRRSYTLSVENADIGSSPRTVIGSDDRFPDWSKSGVVKLYTNNAYTGTAFVVGKHTIATAAHCLVNPYNLSRKGITDIKFFDSNGEDLYENVTPVEYHIPVDYINTNGTEIYCDTYDYALITVQEDLSDYNIFNLGMMTDTFSETQQISVTGFPGDYNNNNTNEMVTANGHFVSFLNWDNVDTGTIFKHHVDVVNGNSGSPIYITESVNNQVYYTVIGIYVSSNTNDNYGIRFNPDILKFYNGNSNFIY